MKLGQWLLQEQIGRGGHSLIYKAFDTKKKKEVAVKVLVAHPSDPEGFLARFQKEGNVLCGLSHPNVLAVFHLGKTGSMHYYVSELVNGGRLREYMKGVPLTNEFLKKHLTELAAGVDYVHSRGWVHCDLKPGNVLIHQEDARAILSDFGVVRDINDNTPSASVSLGTPGYMSPEQASQGRTIDWRSDVYSFGVIAYEMLTGCLPFNGTSAQAIVEATVKNLPPPVSVIRQDLGAEVDELFDLILSKRPGSRPLSATGFCRVLFKLLDKADTEAYLK